MELKCSMQAKDTKERRLKNPTTYFFVNSSLKLNPGKLAAQISHAAMGLAGEIYQSGDEETKEKFFSHSIQNPRTSIVCTCKDQDELYKIVRYFESQELWTYIYVDESGDDYLLEPTVFCTEFVEKDDPRIKAIFKHFHLYRYTDPIYPYIYKKINSNHQPLLAKKFIQELGDTASEIYGYSLWKN